MALGVCTAGMLVTSPNQSLRKRLGPSLLKEQDIGCLGSGWGKLVEICLPLDLAVALILQPVVGWVPCLCAGMRQKSTQVVRDLTEILNNVAACLHALAS